MNQIVVDSSVIVKWLNQQNEKYTTQAESLLDDARTEKIELFTPEIAKYEIGNVILIGKKLSLTQAKEALEFFFSLPINFISQTQDIAESTYKIGQELNITYYDASFLSLAEELGTPLVSDNVKHHGRSKNVKVIPLKDY